ncbi:hypothetical protein [Bartonella sp. OT172YNZD]|uniref:restriction endonuclease n=1 Tax=Bartonella sp. OT172YNZD TaxID=3243572 RepID=UPI0035CFE179
MPRSFKIATLIGSYTPDWALLEREGEQKLYFAHFLALEIGFECGVQPVTNWREYKRTLPEAAHESFQVLQWLLHNNWCMKYLT